MGMGKIDTNSYMQIYLHICIHGYYTYCNGRLGNTSDSSLVPQPRPVILYSRHRRLPKNLQVENPIVFTPNARQFRQLQKHGQLQVIQCKKDKEGRCDLADCLKKLGSLGYKGLMVEGGGRIISSFLENHLADHMIVTISPQVIGGYKLFEHPLHRTIRVLGMKVFRAGEDVIFTGKPEPPSGRHSAVRPNTNMVEMVKGYCMGSSRFSAFWKDQTQPRSAPTIDRLL